MILSPSRSSQCLPHVESLLPPSTTPTAIRHVFQPVKGSLQTHLQTWTAAGRLIQSAPWVHTGCLAEHQVVMAMCSWATYVSSSIQHCDLRFGDNGLECARNFGNLVLFGNFSSSIFFFLQMSLDGLSPPEFQWQSIVSIAVADPQNKVRTMFRDSQTHQLRLASKVCVFESGLIRTHLGLRVWVQIAHPTNFCR